MISNKLNNKIVVITGGSGLLGSKFCESVFLNGGIPINADIDEEKSFDLVKHLNKKHSTDIFDAKRYRKSESFRKRVVGQKRKTLFKIKD